MLDLLTMNTIQISLKFLNLAHSTMNSDVRDKRGVISDGPFGRSEINDGCLQTSEKKHGHWLATVYIIIKILY